MTEMGFRPTGTTIRAARRRLPTGAERCYVRFAVIGDRAGRRLLAPTAGWPQVLAGVMAAAHDVSWCDVSTAGATAYDVRRVQLRVAAAHRPHLVAMDGRLADLGRRDWDVSAIRSHLTHCAWVLAQRGAVLLTTSVGRRAPRHRSRAEQLDAVYEELAQRFGTIHLDHTPSAAVLADRFAEALTGRGLELPRAPCRR